MGSTTVRWFEWPVTDTGRLTTEWSGVLACKMRIWNRLHPRNKVYAVSTLSVVLPCFLCAALVLAVAQPHAIPSALAFGAPFAAVVGAMFYGRWLARYVYSTSRTCANAAVTTAAPPTMIANIQPNHGASAR